VQRLIQIAQNLSLQPPGRPLESTCQQPPKGTQNTATEAADVGVRTVSVRSPSGSIRQLGEMQRQQQEQEQEDWKSRERGFLHRQLLHNLFFRHSCSVTTQYSHVSTPPGAPEPGAEKFGW
jgi:hypothetical protein